MSTSQITRTTETLDAINEHITILNSNNAAPDEIRFKFLGTFVANISFQASLDGINWFSFTSRIWHSNALTNPGTTVNGYNLMSPPPNVRAIVSAYTSGAVDITPIEVYYD